MPNRALGDSLEHLLQVEDRAADHFEHAGGSGLLLQRFAQSIQELAILDRDNGLGGEIGDQLDLRAGEWAHLSPVDSDCTDHLIVLEHWDSEESADLSELHGCDHDRIAISVCGCFCEVGNLDCLPGLQHLAERPVRMAGPNERLASPPFRKCPRHVMHCDGTKSIALAKP
jgi:hypothetical protein